MQSKAKTVKEYFSELPEDRRKALQALREVILKNIDSTYKEGMGYGMPGWSVPHSVYPPGYHCDPSVPLPYAGYASQKNHMSLYLMSLYMNPELEKWFREAWKKTGKKLDMGKSCIRFKKLDDMALDVIGEAVRRVPAKDYVACYERNLKGRRKPARKPAAKARPAAGKSTRKPARKK